MSSRPSRPAAGRLPARAICERSLLALAAGFEHGQQREHGSLSAWKTLSMRSIRVRATVPFHLALVGAELRSASAATADERGTEGLELRAGRAAQWTRR